MAPTAMVKEVNNWNCDGKPKSRSNRRNKSQYYWMANKQEKYRKV